MGRLHHFMAGFTGQPVAGRAEVTSCSGKYGFNRLRNGNELKNGRCTGRQRRAARVPNPTFQLNCDAFFQYCLPLGSSPSTAAVASSPVIYPDSPGNGNFPAPALRSCWQKSTSSKYPSSKRSSKRAGQPRRMSMAKTVGIIGIAQ